MYGNKAVSTPECHADGGARAAKAGQALGGRARACPPHTAPSARRDAQRTKRSQPRSRAVWSRACARAHRTCVGSSRARNTNSDHTGVVTRHMGKRIMGVRYDRTSPPAEDSSQRSPYHRSEFRRYTNMFFARKPPGRNGPSGPTSPAAADLPFGCIPHRASPTEQAQPRLHRTLGVGRAALGAGLIFLCSSRPL